MYRFLTLIFCITGFLSLAFADFPIENLQKYKDSLALFENNYMCCTAFCVSKAGYFATIGYMATGPTDKMKLTLSPGTPNQVELPVTVARIDKYQFVAILKVNTTLPLTALELADDNALYETVPFACIGYPLKKELLANPANYPGTSFGVINSFKKNYFGVCEALGTATFISSNSGAPIINGKGMVIGMAKTSQYNAQQSSIIPSAIMRSLLYEPVISFKPPVIMSNKVNTATTFDMTVSSILPSTEKTTVELTLSDRIHEKHTYPVVNIKDDNYQVNAIPFQPTEKLKSLLLNINTDSTKFKCMVKNFDITVNDQKIPLNTVKTINFGEQQKVILNDNKVITGQVNGLNAVSVMLGDLSTVMDLTRSATIDVNDAEKAPEKIDYEITVKQGNVTVAKLNDEIPVVAFDTVSNVNENITEPAIKQASVIYNLPDRIDNVIASNDGRYLAITFRELHKLAIFDVNSAKIVKFITFPTDEKIKITICNDNIFVAQSVNKIIQRYSLSTFECELSVPYQEQRELSELYWEYKDKIPSLVLYFKKDYDNIYNYYDLKTLQLTNTVNGSELKKVLNSSNIDVTQLKMQRQNNSIYNMAYGGKYFTMVNLNTNIISIYKYSDTPSLLLSLPKINMANLVATQGSSSLKMLDISKCIYFIPDANMMILIPKSNNSLILQRVNIDEELEKSGNNYLYVENTPSQYFINGEKYICQLSIKAKRKGVTYKIITAPETMTISGTGLIEWQVPTDYQKKIENVSINISDETGQNCPYTIKLTAAQK